MPKMRKIFLCLAAISLSLECHAGEPDAFAQMTEKLKFGFQLVSNIFGVDTSQGLGSAFSSAVIRLLSKPRNEPKGENEGGKKPDEGNTAQSGFIYAIIRSMGMNNSQLGAMALNIIIFLAQMISNSFNNSNASSRQQRTSSTRSPFQLIMNHSQVTKLMVYMKDPYLMDRLLAEMNERLQSYPSKDAECIKLLICKTSPFVWGMQKSLKFFVNKEIKQQQPKGEEGDFNKKRKESTTDNKIPKATIPTPLKSFIEEEEAEEEEEDKVNVRNSWEHSEPIQRMLLFLPTMKDVVNHGDKCDERFPSCLY